MLYRILACEAHAAEEKDLLDFDLLNNQKKCLFDLKTLHYC